MKGIGGHQSAKMITCEWLTPPEIVEALGPFDLDPCSPINRPWNTAKKHLTIKSDGLSRKWGGRIWLNPPYGNHTGLWLNRLANHGNGNAIVFARTETKMFFEFVWEKATAVLFLRGRIHFYDTKGNRARANAGAPNVIISYGKESTQKMKNSRIDGKLIVLRKP